ncbi:hypothetical protein Dfri01_44270 [Dyadobacter frigoris]|nr:hypothetical protein Dfri01_44270 [Dyadobacter frigoris]
MSNPRSVSKDSNRCEVEFSFIRKIRVKEIKFGKRSTYEKLLWLTFTNTTTITGFLLKNTIGENEQKQFYLNKPI